MNRLEAFAKVSMLLKKNGFVFMETPWLVGINSIQATIPSQLALRLAPIEGGRAKLDRYRNLLVGSAEQGFIQMVRDGEMKTGVFFSESPCFRADNLDDLHQRYFSKMEIHVNDGSYDPRELALFVKEEILSEFIDSNQLYVVNTPEGCDIVYGDIELGSYGKRSVQIAGTKYEWVYGTAIAWPRTQIAQQRWLSEKPGFEILE